MDIKTVSGQQATDRAGAAEYLKMPLNTLRVISSPAQRPTSGFPDPLPERTGGRDWFALADLDAFKATQHAPPAPAPPVGDPDQLISRDEFAALRGVKPDTMKRYIELSIDAWERGEDGYLPRPGRTTPARNGNVYEWQHGRAVTWAFPAERRTGGRTAGPTPTLDDLAAVLEAAGDTRLKNREIAAALSQRLGTTVSLQVVQRLNRRLLQVVQRLNRRRPGTAGASDDS